MRTRHIARISCLTIAYLWMLAVPALAESLPAMPAGATEGSKIRALEALDAMIKNYTPTPPSIAFPKPDASMKGWNNAGISLLQQLKDKGLAARMIDLFTKAGGTIKVVKGDTKTESGAKNAAKYDPNTKTITVTASRIQENGELVENLGTASLATIGHEFWHAYKDQVVDKGFDPDTAKIFKELVDWLKVRKVTEIENETPVGQRVDAEKVISDFDDFADEYVAALITLILNKGPYDGTPKALSGVYYVFSRLRNDFVTAYENTKDKKTNYRVEALPPPDFLLQLYRLTISSITFRPDEEAPAEGEANPPPAGPKPAPAEIAPEHSSLPKMPNTVPVAVPAAVNPQPADTLARAYYNTPFYNTPVGTEYYNAPFYNTPYYNSPMETLFYNTPFYNAPFDYYDEDGFYIGPKAGWVSVPQESFTTHFSDGSDTSKVKYSDGYDAGFRAGEKIGPWRFEGEFNYRSNDIHLPSSFATSEFSGGTTAYTVLGNVIYDFRTPWLGPVTPHVGGGIGFAHISTQEKFGPFTALDSSDTQFAYQAIAGFRIPLSPNWSFDADYRYVATPDLSLKDPFGDKITQSYNSHTLFLSLTYLFGVTSPPLPAAPATPPSAPPGAALPRAYQVAALSPVTPLAAVPAQTATSRTARQTEMTTRTRFTVRFDDRLAALTPSGIRNLDAAVEAIRAGQNVQIAIDGCEADADLTGGLRCTQRAQSLKQLLARRGVYRPERLLVGG